MPCLPRQWHPFVRFWGFPGRPLGSFTVQQPSENLAATLPASETEQQQDTRSDERRQPRYHVILWDDDDHTYDFVIQMVRKLFGHTVEKGFEIAEEVDTRGRAICLTTTLEHAELKRDQIHAFGRDHTIQRCQGSMSASIEPEA